MARTVFFSFHYQRDIMRAQVVKQHHITKESYTAAGFFDGSLEEKAKTLGDAAVKNLIDRGLSGASVLVVLIGAETFNRRWIHYEIFRSIEYGMGVFGIRIHGIPDPRLGTDTAGPNPFQFLGYGLKSGKLRPMIDYSQSGWQDAPYQSLITDAAAPYLKGRDKPVLNTLFSVYDWNTHDGYNNFGEWVETAAQQAGR